MAEAAVVGGPDPITGEAIYRVRHPAAGQRGADAELGDELRKHVATKIGPIAKPKGLMFVPDLPKTRSGKIMRRLLRDIAQGRALGDTTTLADAGVVETDPVEHRRGGGLTCRSTSSSGRRTGADAAARPIAPRGRPGSAACRSTGSPRSGGSSARCTSPAGCRTRSTSARRSTISDVRWAPVDGSGELAPAPGLKAVDPYDLIIVLAGEATLPPLTDAERTAYKVHKVPYEWRSRCRPTG